MIDLHLHLDGSLSPKLVKRLAQRQGISLPAGEGAGLEALLSVPADCESLNDYLRCFDLPVALLQTPEALTLAVRDLCARLEKQGLLYAELRFAPSQHTRRGMTQTQAVEAAIAGLPPGWEGEGWRFSSQLILCCMRGGEEAANRETIHTAAEFLGKGVCAVDLAGAEALYPASAYKGLFAEAQSLGVPCTLHAGEAAGPESVWQALEMGASRIGHGVRAGEDPSLLQELARRKIPLGAVSHQQFANQGGSRSGGVSHSLLFEARNCRHGKHRQHDGFPHQLKARVSAASIHWSHRGGASHPIGE